MRQKPTEPTCSSARYSTTENADHFPCGGYRHVARGSHARLKHALASVNRQRDNARAGLAVVPIENSVRSGVTGPVMG